MKDKGSARHPKPPIKIPFKLPGFKGGKNRMPGNVAMSYPGKPAKSLLEFREINKLRNPFGLIKPPTFKPQRNNWKLNKENW